MSQIFVNTDNSDPTHKTFNGSKAGKAAAKAEQKMQSVVTRLIGKEAGFTTKKSADAKGYTIRLKVSKVAPSARGVSCGLSGEILYYPPRANMQGAQGELMLSTSMTGNASSTENSEAGIVDCVEAITEELVKKSVPIMRSDAAS